MRTGKKHVAIITEFSSFRLDGDKIKDLLGDELSDYQKETVTKKITLQELDSSTEGEINLEDENE